MSWSSSRPGVRAGDEVASSFSRQRFRRWTPVLEGQDPLAIYRLSAQVISRATGRSATASAAYRAGVRIEDGRTGVAHDYTRRGGVVHTEILAPEHTPAWMLERTALWNAVEAAEKRRDAQLAREVQLALPHELDAGQRLNLVRDFVAREHVGRGMVADIAIHGPHRQGDTRNHHAHVMLTLRSLTAEGFGNKDRSWNERATLDGWRTAWAEAVNAALERAGREQRVDHRSLDAQRVEAERRADEARAANDNRTAKVFELDAARLDRDPEPKIGHIATALERRGEPTERGEIWRETVARNLDRFRDWLHMQRNRLDGLWARMERAMGNYRQKDRERAPEASQEAGSGIPVEVVRQSEIERMSGNRTASSTERVSRKENHDHQREEGSDRDRRHDESRPARQGWRAGRDDDRGR